MGFLLKCFIAIALVYFAVNKGELSALMASAVSPARAIGENGSKIGRQEPLSELQRAAAAKLMGAAREHCLAKPADCLALLKSAGAEVRKPEHKDH
ncbi:hypothetical protein [Methylocystis heyeri]|uniref:Uncharacterized protein n=1 Tax=Methylocystis heyeri TaxID=391905 RepID=A0A6B8KA78_9HYPH|nr:hypothetical protein [Methylocystis heyeri]QGM44637.1 hypothetical protein H2LOC_002440 [Methylocystis heyeri]